MIATELQWVSRAAQISKEPLSSTTPVRFLLRHFDVLAERCVGAKEWNLHRHRLLLCPKLPVDRSLALMA
jgi:hypothetical protein